MKVAIQQKALAGLASQAASVADPKAPMPIVGMVVLSVEGDRLHIAATDLYTSIRASAPCTVESAGKPVAVPAKQLKDVVGQMPEGEITLVLDGAKLRLSSGRSRYHLPTTPAEDAPEIPKPPAASVEVDVGELSRALDAVSPAVSTESTRPHLCGTHVHIEGRVIRAVSTDGHRLQLCETPHKGDELPPMLVPPKGAALLRALGKGAAQLSVKDGNLFAQHEATTVGVRLVDETFPPYGAVVPKKAKQVITIERGMLLDATKRALSVAGPIGALRLTTNSDGLTLAAEDQDGSGGVEELRAEAVEAETIGLNGRYLCDALAKCSADDIELWLSGPLDPVCLRAEGYIGVIMPMRT